ncbi:synaptonemal complex protein 2-like isoform 3-T3 [Anableps anableps]
MRAMFELQMDDCLLRGDSSRLVSLLHYEGLSTSTLTRLHHLVTKELRSSGFSKVLVVLKSVSILSENKDDLQTLVNLGLTAKVMLWFEAVHDLLTSDLQKGSTSLLSLTEEFFDYFLVSSILGSEVWSCLCLRSVSGSDLTSDSFMRTSVILTCGPFVPQLLGQASLPAGQLSVLLLHLAHLSLEPGVHFPLRLEAIRTFNSILESLSRQERRLIQNDQNQTQKLSQVAAAVLTVGDYEFQVSLSEALCRLTPRREREQRANQWFLSSDIRAAFCDIRDADFEVDCRRFLNFVNRYHGDQRSRVYTFPCLKAFLSSTQLFRPKDDKLDEFWIDFNIGSGCVSFFIDDPQGFLWGSIHLQKEDVDYYSLEVKQNETVLSVWLTSPIMHLNTRSHVVELTFNPDHHRELEEAAGRVFNVPVDPSGSAPLDVLSKQACPVGAGGAVRAPPSADKHVGRSYSRKKPPSKSQLKILPLSSPSSEDESTSVKSTASNRAEVLFDRLQHSTPVFSAGFQTPFDPPDAADVSEAHLLNLNEPPSGEPQGAELQMTQNPTEGLEEGNSSPSKKENLRKREAADSGYLSDQAEGVTPHKRKAEPLQNWEESYSPATGAELAAEEVLDNEEAWPDLAKQKAEPESHLTSDITAALKSFKAQLEQRFTGSWQHVQAEVLASLKDCQQHVSSLLTAVHQHRLALLQRFEDSITDQLEQLKENSVHLNAIDSQILVWTAVGHP